MKKFLWIPVLIVLFVVGCKNAATPTPVISIASLSGKWDNTEAVNKADGEDKMALANIVLVVTDLKGKNITGSISITPKGSNAVQAAVDVTRSSGNTYKGSFKDAADKDLYTDLVITFSDAGNATGSYKDGDKTYEFAMKKTTS